ncbi:MAG: hypothetical protein MK188_09740 [Gammaproteobacteria bacterium]|nr:hypothetical protein [Gammaproteobacteria bacterium]
MSSKKTNIDKSESYQNVVEELSQDLLKQQLKDNKTLDFTALEARILKTASSTPQVFESDSEHNSSWWVAVKTGFLARSPISFYPFVTAAILVAAVMIVGSPIPTDEGIADEVITFTSPEIVDSEQDLESTLQELWFVEDEILFEVGI